MDILMGYICLAYVLVFAACLAGAFSVLYQANFLQRLSIFILAIWSVWRIQLIWEEGWSYPHEPLLATCLALYALGSIVKTIVWKYHDHRSNHATEA